MGDDFDGKTPLSLYDRRATRRSFMQGSAALGLGLGALPLLGQATARADTPKRGGTVTCSTTQCRYFAPANGLIDGDQFAYTISDGALTDDAVRAADVVVTMGCGDACPIFPGKRYEDWVLADPAGQDVAAVRPVRDEIRARIEALIAELLSA